MSNVYLNVYLKRKKILEQPCLVFSFPTHVIIGKCALYKNYMDNIKP